MIYKRLKAKAQAHRLSSVQSSLTSALQACDWEKSLALANECWKIQGKNIRGSLVLGEQGIFKITHLIEEKSIYVTSLSRSDWLYANGFKARSNQLAKSYALENVDLKDGDIVIDCGANYGDIALHFDSLGIRSQYIGIEPSPLDFKCLCLNLKESAQESVLENIALSEKPGHLEFYIDRERASSSLLCPPSYSETTIVEVQTLDILCKKAGIQGKTIKLLKLEAEGVEPEICRGMDNTMESIHYIAADLGPERGSNEEVTAPDVINFLLGRGFEVKGFGDRFSLRILFENKRFMRS
jgi:FkbM family methyltransferase